MPSEWRHWYFLGFASARPGEIQIDPEQLQSLLAAVGVQAAVGTPGPLDPRHLINHKGVTAWLSLFFFTQINDEAGLQAVAENRALILVPASFLQQNYSSHVNWPAEMLARYRLDARDAHPLILPFIVHESAPQPQGLQQSLRSADGSLEIFAVAEFSETEPEKLLWLVDRMARHRDQMEQ
jgi:hypothetical protein